MKTRLSIHSLARYRMWIPGLLLTATLWTGCGGVDVCKCLEEAEKENPDPATMEKCRSAFSDMEMDEVQKAVEKCRK